MYRNDFKIIWRNLWKHKGFTLLNILGLTLGFTGFILSYQYINREQSYDSWNPNYQHIYQVGTTVHGQFSTETLPSFAKTIKDRFPEITLAGRKVEYNYGQYPLFGESTVFVRHSIAIDSSAAAIFQIKSKQGPLYRSKEQQEATLIKEKYANVLFKDPHDFSAPKSVAVLSLAMGVKQEIYGIAAERPLSNIDADLIMIKEIETETEGNPFMVQTFIQVKPGTNIPALTEKINQLYQQEIASLDRIKNTTQGQGSIYLDPLSHLHLQPKAGSNTAYLGIWMLGILSVIILVLACINFANMMMAQADHRLKELAIKKILGSSRRALVFQLLTEVFLTTLIAAGTSYLMLILSGNILQKWFNDDIQLYLFESQTFQQLFGMVLICTVISGLYPAIKLSGMQLNQAWRGRKIKTWRKGLIPYPLLVFQFFIAFSFMAGMLVIQGQLKFIQETDKGFEPAQIINFKGIGMYYDSKLNGSFYDFKQRLLQDPHIEGVTTASNIPGSLNIPIKFPYQHKNQVVDLDHVGVDVDFFEVLNIATRQGNPNLSVQQILSDSTKNYAVINESAAQLMNLGQAVGTQLAGCKTNLEIIAVVQNSKAYGFEQKIQPTIYTFKDECAESRIKATLLVKAKPGKVHETIQAVDREWAKNSSAERIPLDYDFMDQNYVQLQEKQLELQQVFQGFTILTVIIAALGLFSMSAYQISLRKKELSVRKVLGASVEQLFFQLNKSFMQVFAISCLIGIPVSYWLIHQWLNHFAYHIEIQFWHFALTALLVFLLFLMTVSFQSIRAARTKAIEDLKAE